MLCNKHLILPPGHKLDFSQSIEFILLKVANDSMLMRNEMACNLRQLQVPIVSALKKQCSFVMSFKPWKERRGRKKLPRKLLKILKLKTTELRESRIKK